ncbi:MAG: hypothetical protein K9W44_10885 [Candidatus Lokiarchaeota archaeon]|nr:hypothetical protein [Candidatus Harpocratesius repetitus]
MAVFVAVLLAVLLDDDAAAINSCILQDIVFSSRNIMRYVADFLVISSGLIIMESVIFLVGKMLAIFRRKKPKIPVMGSNRPPIHLGRAEKRHRRSFYQKLEVLEEVT